ncbi:site-specific integrase [Pelomicrobium methylotrophicum]|uniref:Integrase SAM-like N-terminal domain-containing protein n=1 Tax=Pelomicrobium methylotrophicum TaxID=2602750 RepID=A0A5C7EI75_9PROT|nr:hypothetical protein FR698_08315 [Pelomicrobium methylotrophicum]
MPNQSRRLSNDPDRPRLLDRLRDAIRRRYDGRRREEACIHWTKRYVHFHGKKHPSTLGEAEVTAFLSPLATERHVSASSHNQALSAPLFVQALGLARYDGAGSVLSGRYSATRETLPAPPSGAAV